MLMRIKLKKIFSVLFLFSLSTLLGGCLDYKDIDEKTILTAVALDEKDGEIYLYVEVANIEGSSNSDRITSYNVCYTKLLRHLIFTASIWGL